MAVLYGKIRIYPPDSTPVSVVIDGDDGTTRTVTVTEPCTDVIVKAMEEYTISVGGTDKATEIVNCGRIVIVNL